MLSRFDRIPERDGRTDRQTHRQTDGQTELRTSVHVCCVTVRTSEVRERLNMVRRRCAEMTVLSSKEAANRPTVDGIRTWAESLDSLLADKC